MIVKTWQETVYIWYPLRWCRHKSKTLIPSESPSALEKGLSCVVNSIDFLLMQNAYVMSCIYTIIFIEFKFTYLSII